MYAHIKPIPEGTKCNATKDHKDCENIAVGGVFPYKHIYVCQDHFLLLSIGMVPNRVKERFDRIEKERTKEQEHD